MFELHSNHYAQWRRDHGLEGSLREGREAPPENLLQAIWFHQRLQRDRLRAVDGRTIRVLHPGFWNREPGPDFRRAMVQFGTEAPRLGDIEIDLTCADWKSHGHEGNPNFRDVVLHVVWKASDAAKQPTLAMESVLDSPIGDLSLWLGSESARAYPAALLGQCCGPLRDLSAERLTELLRQAAFIRLQSKAAHLQARAKEAGWEQALWEGLFRALGYKQNLWPMQRLAELRARICPDRGKTSVLTVQSRLLGIGGLLPDEIARSHTGIDDYVRRLWDGWWRERDGFRDVTLPPASWNFAGVRPANHPQRRLALAAHWLADGRLPARLEQWCTRKLSPELQPSTLLDAIGVPEDDFWSHQFTLRSKRSARPQPLLGSTRVTDLAVNVILPWLWVRAVEGRNELLRLEMERRFFFWPAAEDNSVLKLARQRLLGGRSGRALSGAAAQQGLLQVVRDFCEHSNAVCAECKFPEMIRHWPG